MIQEKLDLFLKLRAPSEDYSIEAHAVITNIAETNHWVYPFYITMISHIFVTEDSNVPIKTKAHNNFSINF